MPQKRRKRPILAPNKLKWYSCNTKEGNAPENTLIRKMSAHRYFPVSL